jgi:hypothetical protein
MTIKTCLNVGRVWQKLAAEGMRMTTRNKIKMRGELDTILLHLIVRSTGVAKAAR